MIILLRPQATLQHFMGWMLLLHTSFKATPVRACAASGCDLGVPEAGRDHGQPVINLRPWDITC